MKEDSLSNALNKKNIFGTLEKDKSLKRKKRKISQQEWQLQTTM